MDGWNTIVSFSDGAHLQVRTVSFREGTPLKMNMFEAKKNDGLVSDEWLIWFKGSMLILRGSFCWDILQEIQVSRVQASHQMGKGENHELKKCWRLDEKCQFPAKSMIYAHTMCKYVYTCRYRIVEMCKIPASTRLGPQLRGLCVYTNVYIYVIYS